MSRGVRGELLFKDESDYELFIQIVKEIQEVTGFILHSYCLMSNHFHMQIETRDISISKIMEKLLKTYAMNFNMKYHFVGHVFQGRFKGILIEDSVYFLETSRYIHLNPVKASMVCNPEDYRYSSYRYYIGCEQNEVLFKDKTLGFFRDSDQLEYAKFVEAKINHEVYEASIMNGLGEDEQWLPW